ncbi:MAG: SusF/SusE family outer membrane protein [Sediminibacterium sp.]|nr:SusF/SusE family outer membrane protein [Sediminibacterium sp.]
MKKNYYIVACLICLVELAGCKKENYAELNKGNTPLAITASVNTIILKENDRDKDAVVLNWTTGGNKGTNAAIRYVLQLAKQGTSFANPVAEDLGLAVYNRKFTVSALNDSLRNHFKATPGTEFILEARVVAQAQAEGVSAEISPVAVIKIIPYQPVSATLYLIGDATPNGWDNTNATALTAIATEPGGFTWTGQLSVGDFKFITALGQWVPSYNKSATAADSLFYRADFGQPDNKFHISTMGGYTLKVNLLSMAITISQPTQPTTPPYSRLWMVGDATPNGWNINSPNEMRVDSGNMFVFTYHELLTSGEFKIPTATGNWGGDFYMPLANHPAITATGVQLVPGGSPDNKWQITTAGAYKIKLDLLNMKISIQPFTPYTQLWLVGDATPVGWNITSPAPMTPDPVNPYIFTWQGAMTAGEFKIPTNTGNWGCDYFMPMVNHQDINSPLAKLIPAGNPDNKWLITNPGNYKITINQLKETIDIVKL